MGRRKPRVPFAYAVVPSVRLDSADWSRIEREYGSDLSGNVRDKILSHTQLFVEFAVFENAAASSELAAKRLKALRIPDCSSHGLRKAIARRMAEAGMSPHQIQAITGHTTLKEIERYTKAARQKLMAEMAMRGLDEPVAQIEDKR
jgi:integrase